MSWKGLWMPTEASGIHTHLPQEQPPFPQASWLSQPLCYLEKILIQYVPPSSPTVPLSEGLACGLGFGLLFVLYQAGGLHGSQTKVLPCLPPIRPFIWHGLWRGSAAGA